MRIGTTGVRVGPGDVRGAHEAQVDPALRARGLRVWHCHRRRPGQDGGDRPPSEHIQRREGPGGDACFVGTLGLYVCSKPSLHAAPHLPPT